MDDYLARIDAAAPEARWPMVRSWLYSEPLPLFQQLRAERPVLVLPELTFCTALADCNLILTRHDVFGVDLYVPKQGTYFMAQDDTAAHWREKSIMKAILDFEDIPAMRAWVGQETAQRLEAAHGSLDIVPHLTRTVPAGLVQTFFGFDVANPKDMIDWSYWSQQDAFHNQPFDAPGPVSAADITFNREKASVMMAAYLAALVAGRAAAVKLGSEEKDPVSRLLRLSFSGGVRFDIQNVIFNTAGLLISAVETTSHASVNALAFLMADQTRFIDARMAAMSDDPAEFDGFVFEALRFRPAFPYFFRTCHKPTVLGGGTPHAVRVPEGTTVLAVTQSGMFDAAGFDRPETFDPTRERTAAFTFGLGLHECLGRAVAAAMLPEIVRQVLRRPGLSAPSAPDYQGTKVPQSWRLTWDT